MGPRYRGICSPSLRPSVDTTLPFAPPAVVGSYPNSLLSKERVDVRNQAMLNTAFRASSVTSIQAAPSPPESRAAPEWLGLSIY
jgi:hypothetical protein